VKIAATAPSLQARKQQVVRDAIWDAASDLFIENGFDETTVEEIAEAAGVSRRTFFRYFSSKNDLMAQGLVSYAETISETIDSCPRSQSLAQVLRETVLRVARESAAHPRTRKIMEIASKSATAREAQLSRMAELQERVAEAYSRRGHKDDLAPRVLAGLTLSMLGVTFRSWFERDQQDIGVTAEHVLATLGRIVCPPGGRGR